MNTVVINISKGKSMAAALRPMGEVAFPSQEFLRAEVRLEQMPCIVSMIRNNLL